MISPITIEDTRCSDKCPFVETKGTQNHLPIIWCNLLNKELSYYDGFLAECNLK